MADIVNAAWADVKPTLSVLIPFLRDDPTPLLNALAREADVVGTRVEIVVLDDGTNSLALTTDLKALISDLPLAARLITRAQNLGRAKGRNLLAEQARGGHLLFLDADMMPDSPVFLSAWLDQVEHHNTAVAFGGFSLLQASNHKAFRVHRTMAAQSDCLPASVRQQQPEKHLFTSNLLIRRDVFEAHAFDNHFNGWGWEDVEWGMRIAAQHAIVHPDIPATHMGLDTVDALIRKYRQSAPNFARVASLHPDIVSTYPSYKAAMAIKTRRMGKPVAFVAETMARSEWLPVRLRAFSLRVFRAALYADALSEEANA